MPNKDRETSSSSTSTISRPISPPSTITPSTSSITSSSISMNDLPAAKHASLEDDRTLLRYDQQLQMNQTKSLTHDTRKLHGDQKSRSNHTEKDVRKSLLEWIKILEHTPSSSKIFNLEDLEKRNQLVQYELKDMIDKIHNRQKEIADINQALESADQEREKLYQEYMAVNKVLVNIQTLIDSSLNILLAKKQQQQQQQQHAQTSSVPYL
jgi:hypothetical protein